MGALRISTQRDALQAMCGSHGETMKPGGPLKRRKRLRPKGKKIRNHVDEPLRRAYMAENKICELSALLWQRVDGKWSYIPHPGGFAYDSKIEILAADPHHVMPACKHDLVTNLIATGRLAHNWMHDHRADATCLSLWVKAQKNELDVHELERITGKCLAGYVEGLRPTLPVAIEKQADLLRVLKGEAA